MHNFPRSEKGTWIKLTLSAVIALILLIATIYLLGEQTHKRLLNEMIPRLLSQADLRKNMIETQLDTYRRDTIFLSNVPPVPGFTRAVLHHGIDVKENTPKALWETRMQRIFRSYIEAHPDVFQVRFIGIADQGRELVRVERQGNHVIEIGEDQLQQKGDTEYFKKTTALDIDEIYISSANLNREHGQVQIPHVPTIRAATPVYAPDGKVFGIVIININLTSTLSQFASNLPSDFQVYLTNNDGDYIYHPNTDLRFGFDLGKPHRWQDDFSFANNETVQNAIIFNGSSGLTYTAEKNITLNDKNYLKIIMSLPEENLSKRILQIQLQAVEFIITILFLLSALFYIYYRKNKEIKDKQLQLASIVENSSDAIISKTLDGTISSWNKSAENLFGYTENEAIGKKSIDLIVPESFKSEESFILKSISLGKIVDHFTSVRHHKYGALIDVSITVSPIRNSEGKVIGASKVVRDIREQKELERQLKQLNESLDKQVRERTAELEKAKMVADSANQAKSNFLANMSHEIRTPMNAVLGMLQLLQQTALDAHQMDYVEKTKSAARTLLGILNDILDFSKVEAGKLTLDIHPFKFDKMLRDVGIILGSNVGDKKIEILFDVDPHMPTEIVGDALRLQQILVNLAGNAIKFTQQGEVIVSTQWVADQNNNVGELTIAVRDTGIGISKDQQERIFNGFEQAEASTARHFGGTGLGLAICRRLVELMGGKLKIDSEPGKGSCFYFSIPCQIVALKEALKPSIQLRDLCALIVDDNESSRQILTNIVNSFGWSADVCSNGSQALALLTQNKQSGKKFDVILLDWNMPDIDGWEVSTRIRQLYNHEEAPIIVMITAYAREALAQQHLENPPLLNGFLVKPITASTLLDTVADACAMSRGEKPVPTTTAVQIEQTLKGLRLLLVEDNPVNQLIASELLKSHGAEIEIVDGGLKAISTLENIPAVFDLVLMDIQMPDMDGYTATKEIRNRLGLRDIPIIAMTANAMSSDREAALAAGMNDHVTKPFEISELINVILQYTHTEPVALKHLKNELLEFSAINFLDNDQKLTVLKAFSGNTLDLISKLREQITHEQLSAIRETLHNIKGSSAMVGANYLSKLAADAEFKSVEELKRLLPGLQHSAEAAARAGLEFSKNIMRK